MSKYTRKQRQTAPQDQFVGFWDRLFDKAAPYTRAILITAITAAAIIGAVWGISSFLDHKAQAATEAFGRAVRIYEAELITDDNPVKADEENAVPRFKTERERADATLAELDAFDKKYGSSPTVEEARLFRAGVLYDLGRWDDAAAQFERFAKESHALPLQLVAREGLGLCDEARGKLDEALVEYQRMEPKTGDFFRDRALWDEARVLGKKGDKKAAAAKLKELMDKLPGSPLKDEAQNQLAQLEAS
jgi:hypothetical protein